MNFIAPLYKKDSKGKIRVLSISADDGTLTQISGILDGKKVTHSSICKPKNVGKANETTITQQAVNQAESLVKKKLDEGYFLSISEAETEVVILPMLAKDYKKEFKKVTYPCYIQPKLDGMRALGSENNTLTSRKGKVIETLKHLKFNHLNGTVIDGELYAHGLSFQENMKIIKKYRKGETENVKFHVYDLISSMPFIERYKLLHELTKGNDCIRLVPTLIIHNEEDLKAEHIKFVAAGYEGTIVRHSDAPYGVNKRDSQLLKYKDFIDEAYTVIDVVPSEKDPTMGVVRCWLYQWGQEFNCGMKFSHKDRAEILKNKDKYIGQTAEVRFFEFTDSGIPRFPVCHGFRLDK